MYKNLESSPKIQYTGATWSSLRGKDCSSIKHDPMKSLFSIHYLRYVLRMWYTWKLEKNYTAKFFNPQGYREPYSRRILIMDVRIFLIPKREHPPTIKANEARVTRKLVVVMLENLTQQSRKKTPIVNRLIQQFETHPNRDSLIEDWNKTEEFLPFNEKSKELITSVGDTEYFELCGDLF